MRLFLSLASLPTLIIFAIVHIPVCFLRDEFFRKILGIFLTVKPVLYTDAMVTVETLMINKYKASNHDSVYCVRTSKINVQNSGFFCLQSIQQLQK